MRCLIVGGGSPLGIVLARRLLKSGHEVICLDDFRSVRLDGVRTLRAFPGFSLICRDGRDGVRCVPDMVVHMIRLGLGEDRALAGTTAGMDAFMASVNLAAETGARLLLIRRLDTFDARGGVSRASRTARRSAVEQDLEKEWQLMTALCCGLQRRHRVEYRIARVFNLYGLASSRGLDALVLRASTGGTVEIQGPEDTHWFCHLNDATEGVFRLMTTALAAEAPSSFDFACAEPVQGRTAGWMVGTAFGTEVREHPRRWLGSDPSPQLDTAFRWLDWQAATHFAQGATSTIRSRKEAFQSSM